MVVDPLSMPSNMTFLVDWFVCNLDYDESEIIDLRGI